MARTVNGVLRIKENEDPPVVIQTDKATTEWFKQHPSAQTTVTQCEKCGLWYKAILGHECEVE